MAMENTLIHYLKVIMVIFLLKPQFPGGFPSHVFYRKSFRKDWLHQVPNPSQQLRAQRCTELSFFGLTSVACGCRCSLSAAASWAWEVTWAPQHPGNPGTSKTMSFPGANHGAGIVAHIGVIYGVLDKCWWIFDTSSIWLCFLVLQSGTVAGTGSKDQSMTNTSNILCIPLLY